MRLNLDNKTTNWLKIGNSLQLIHVDENVSATNGNVIRAALDNTPDIPVTNADGSWGAVTNNQRLGSTFCQPCSISYNYQKPRKRNQIFGNVYAEIQFAKGLTFRSELSGNFDFSTEDHFSPTYTFGKGTPSPNSGSSSAGQNFYTVIRNFLTYNHNFGKLKFDALAGHESQESSFENVSGARRNFASNNVQGISAGESYHGHKWRR